MTKITKNTGLVIEELSKGNPVALPTETVYGLAANSLNPDAVLKIFQVKRRPHFDPLIVHISDITEINKYAKNIPDEVYKIADKYSPGPITYVIQKKKIIHDLVTSGLNTVAIRIPSHPLFLKILKELKFPLAAPSANLFGRISPTSAVEVLKELDGKINYILDGGKCKIGIESTILGFYDGEIIILRPGYITKSMIEKITDKKILIRKQKGNINSPGLLKNHYAPRTPLYYIEGEINNKILKLYNAGFFDISKFKSLNNLASNLFSEIRKLDEKNFDFIMMERVINDGIGFAINDRLGKASTGSIRFEENKITFITK